MHSMFKKKKGQQTASRASILVLVITVAIILYVLFLPPDERNKLLNEDPDGSSSSDDDDSTLLLKYPGRLDYLKDNSFDYSLPSFNLYSTTSAALLKDADSIYVKRTTFSEKNETFVFTIDDLENTKNVQLSFKREKARGRLTISVNGKPVLQKYIEKDYQDPIAIPKEYLVEGQNNVDFSVSSPGLLFFIINEYQLSDIKVTAQVTDVTTLQNKQVFFIKDAEKNNLDYATLTFMTNCKTNEKGQLTVYVNYQTLYEGVPDCVTPTKINIGRDSINNGENRLRFLATSGSYIIDQIKIKTYLKESIYSTYYFEISDDLYSDIYNDDKDINMSIIFVTDEERGNDLEVEINGHKFTVETDEREYDRIIDPYIRKGNNAITLRPMSSTLEVVELKIETQTK